MFSSLCCKNSRLLYHWFCVQSRPPLRSIGLLGKGNFKSVLLNKSHYKLVYDFPHVIFIGSLVRTKRWVPAVAVGLTPFLYYFSGTIAPSVLTAFSAGIYFLLGIPLSKLTRNVVGKMYITKEGDITDVLISSIDHTGRRIDRIHNVDDIINTEFPSIFDRYLGFIRLAIENTNVHYKLNIYSGKYIDEDACNYIIGGIYTSKKEKDDVHGIKKSGKA